VADEDRDKTTFVCHEGAYRYIRLPFGLSNAPATFQRAIDMILGGLKWKSCLVYLDDIIVFSQSAGEHVEHLREVFTRGCQDKYPISRATVIANKTTTSDIILPEQLGILTLWRPGHPIGGLFFFNGQSWTNILRHILDYIRILAGIRPKLVF